MGPAPKAHDSRARQPAITGWPSSYRVPDDPLRAHAGARIWAAGRLQTAVIRTTHRHQFTIELAGGTAAASRNAASSREGRVPAHGRVCQDAEEGEPAAGEGVPAGTVALPHHVARAGRRRAGAGGCQVEHLLERRGLLGYGGGAPSAQRAPARISPAPEREPGGGPQRVRTADLRRAKAALSQLLSLIHI